MRALYCSKWGTRSIKYSFVPEAVTRYFPSLPLGIITRPRIGTRYLSTIALA